MRRLCALLIVLVAAAPVAAAAVPNDPLFEDQYGLRIVGAPTAWDTSRGGGVTVAVVDTGVDLDHPDLAGNLVGGQNFVEDNQPPQDDHGHGTHVAGIVGALTGNGRGVASMAPEVSIMPVRVLAKDEDSNGATGTCADVQAGIRWAADNGADVINLSLGPEFVVVDFVLGSCIEGPVQEAWSKGAIPVVAAGNDSLLVSPYEDMNAIVVSATDRDDLHAGYSNGTARAKWGMAAPGNRIVSTWLDDPNDDQDGYAEASGTSMAAPHVAGGAALLRSLGVAKQRTVDTLLETAEDLGPSGEDATYGHGRLDAAAAVASVTGGSGGSEEPGPGPTGAGEPEPEPQPVGGPSSAPSPGGGGSTGEPSPTGGSSDGESSPQPNDTGGPSATATPERGDVSGAAEGDGGPSPVAAPPTSDDDGSLLLPVAGIMGALALSGGGLLLWLRRGGP